MAPWPLHPKLGIFIVEGPKLQIAVAVGVLPVTLEMQIVIAVNLALSKLQKQIAASLKMISIKYRIQIAENKNLVGVERRFLRYRLQIHFCKRLIMLVTGVVQRNRINNIADNTAIMYIVN